MKVLDPDLSLERSVNHYRDPLQTSPDYKILSLDLYNDRYQELIAFATIADAEYEYEVRLNIGKYHQIISHGCNCYRDYSTDACDHVVFLADYLKKMEMPKLPYHYAVDLEAYYRQQEEEKLRLQKEADLQKHRQDIDNSHQYLKDIEDKVQDNYFDLYGPECLHLEVNAALVTNWYQRTIDLSFKIGMDAFYTLKDLGTFITAMENNEYYSYGKKLAFRHRKELLDPQSLIIYQFIKDNYTAPTENSLSQKKSVIHLDLKQIQKYFDLAQKVQVQGELISYKEQPLTFRLVLDHHGEFYYLKFPFELDYYFMTPCGLFRADKNTLSDFPANHDEKALKLVKALYSLQSKPLVKEDALKLIRLIRQYPQSLNVEGLDENAEETVTETGREVYFDLENTEQMYVKITYRYGEEKVEGFDPDNQKLSSQAHSLETFLETYAQSKDEENHKLLYSLNNADTYALVQNGIPQIQKMATVYASANILNLNRVSNYHFTVGVSVQNDLLEIDVQSPNLPKEEIGDILRSYRRRQKFHKLKNGQTISLGSDDLVQLDQLLQTNGIDPGMLKDGKTSLPTYRAFDLSKDEQQKIVINRSASYKKLLEQLKNVEANKTPIPKEFDSIFRDYQKFGFHWLSLLSDYGLGGILADDMGLGKTIQVLALLEALQPKESCSLIVCPSSLILNWKDEAAKFNSKLKIGCVLGSQSKRAEMIGQLKDYDILVTSYDYLRNDIELYDKTTFFYAILDEAQYIKNQTTKNAHSVKKLKALHRLALTGTPIENSIAELWSIFDFVMPQYLYNYHYFKDKYEVPIIKEHNEDAQKKLKSLVEPFILRRTKKEVLKDLPEKMEQILPLEFSEEEEKLYLANLSMVNLQLQKILKTPNQDKIEILAMLTRLRQICCDARLVYENIHTVGSKMLGCLDIIQQMIDNKRKVIVFSSFTSILSLLEEELQKEKISYYKLVGGTNKEDRHRMVEAFQNDDTEVFLISLKAGGTGLNITAASCVIHFDPWWNVSAQNQATDRAYRIGQTKDVLVYKLIIKNTIEEKIVKMQERKQKIADTFVENNEGSLMSMDTDTLIKLLS